MCCISFHNPKLYWMLILIHTKEKTELRGTYKRLSMKICQIMYEKMTLHVVRIHSLTPTNNPVHKYTYSYILTYTYTYTTANTIANKSRHEFVSTRLQPTHICELVWFTKKEFRHFSASKYSRVFMSDLYLFSMGMLVIIENT